MLTYLTLLTSIFSANDKEIHYAWVLENNKIFQKPLSNANVSHYALNSTLLYLVFTFDILMKHFHALL